MDTLTTSITIYGPVKKGNWGKFYLDAKIFAAELGYALNYYGYTSSSHNSTKMTKISKTDAKLLAKLDDDTVSHITLESLPVDFSTAAFDYDLMIVRNQEFITLVVNSSDFEKIDLKAVITTFSKYSNVTEIQVYEMNRDESPLIFASKANPISCFPSLKMLSSEKQF